MPASSVKAFVLNFGDDDAMSIELSPSTINNDDTRYSLDGIRLNHCPTTNSQFIIHNS